MAIKIYKYKNILTKEFLIKEYINKQKPMYEIAKKIGCNKETIRKKLIKYHISRRCRGYRHGLTMRKHYCKCGNQITYQSAIYGQGQCRSCSKKGQITHGRWGIYKNIKMRSSYEIAYAKWLDKQNIKWKYESKTFDLGNTTYTPDFYLPETNKYIEIKGYWREDAKKKFKKFKTIYSETKIQVLNYQKLIKKGIL